MRDSNRGAPVTGLPAGVLDTGNSAVQSAGLGTTPAVLPEEFSFDSQRSFERGGGEEVDTERGDEAAQVVLPAEEECCG